VQIAHTVDPLCRSFAHAINRLREPVMLAQAHATAVSARWIQDHETTSRAGAREIRRVQSTKFFSSSWINWLVGSWIRLPCSSNR
jgi:hypothetical protein